MAASKNNNAHKPELTLPASVGQTLRLVQRVAHSATWGERIARQHLPPSAADFGPRLFRRFEATSAPGIWADAFAQRFVTDELAPSSAALTLAPYAPAQRQVSAARQGALPWSSGDSFGSGSLAGDSFTSASFPAPIARSAEPAASQPLIGDLMTGGWSVQSNRPAMIRRDAEPAAREPDRSARRSDSPQAATPQAADPIRRAPVSAPQPESIQRSPASQPESIQRSPAPQPEWIQRSAATPSQADPIQRSPDAASEDSADSAVQDSEPGSNDTAFVASEAESSSADLPAASASSDSLPPMQTAATRPMAFFRGTPQNPLMRMGLPEIAGDGGDSAQPQIAESRPASGELPVVRPSREEPAAPALSPTSSAINRRAEPQITPVQLTPQLTSDVTSSSGGEQPASSTEQASSRSEQPASSSQQASSVASAEIQRESSTTAPAQTEPQAATSQVTSPEVQRESAPEAGSRSEVALAAPAEQAPVQRSDDQPGAASGATEAASPAAAASDQASAQSESAAQVSTATSSTTAAQAPVSASSPTIARSTLASARPNVQRDAVTPSAASDNAATASTDSFSADVSAAPPAVAPAQRAPTIQRQPSQPVRPAAIDAVLPLATRLLQRYSTGSAQGSSGSMPLLRAYAPGVGHTVMRSADQPGGGASSAQAQLATPTSATSTASASTPVVHRSAIVPVLSSPTVQREPAPGAATPASVSAAPPETAAPALEWSALPLLQRLTTQHAFASAPSSPAAPATSVAAQVLHRFPIDAPAALPLLRLHAPASVLPGSDQAPADGAARQDAPGSEDVSATQTRAEAASQGSESSGLATQPAPKIHRSAIVPSISGAAVQPLTLLRVHTPDAPASAQTATASSGALFQRSPDSTIGAAAQPTSPLVMRSPEQPASTPTSEPGETSPSTPVVHRSAIVPVLSSPTVQREPASGAATPTAVPSAPREPAAPALEWSALPLLQRLTTQHALAAAPARPAAPATSVAAQVLHRFPIDAPAALPLLRLHAPEAPQISSDAEPGESATTQRSADATNEPPARTSILSSFVRRSAILPSLPGLAAHESAAQAAAIGGESDQSGNAAGSTMLPTLQRFFGGLPNVRLPALGGIQNSVDSLAGQGQSLTSIRMPNLPLLQNLPGNPQQAVGDAISQATGAFGQMQGTIDQITGLPGQLQGQIQGAFNQVTGLPGQLQGQVQGAIDQVTGLPGQLQGQVQGAFNQVTGLPGQLQGQLRGAIDQVTGLPGQMQSQLQGAFDQVTSLPGQLQGQVQGAIDQVAGLPGQMQSAASNTMSARGSALTLLRPVRAESQSAPVGDDTAGDSASGSESALQSPGASSSAAATPAQGEPGKQAKPDIDALAQQVYARLRHRLLIDRERLGR